MNYYDYPLTAQLIDELFELYRDNSKAKGNTWKSEEETSIKFLMNKMVEEYEEVLLAVKGGNYDHVRKELKDLMLVTAMVHERCRV